MATNAPSDVQLKKAFQQLNAKIIRTIQSASVVDFMFEKGVLNNDENYTLSQISDNREKTRKLLTLLHSKQFPDAFVILRQSLLENYFYLVEEIDKQAGETETSSLNTEPDSTLPTAPSMATAGGDNAFMTKEHKDRLLKHRDELVSAMNPEDVINKLAGVLTGREVGRLTAKTHTRESQVEELLNLIALKSDSAFARLIQALKDTNQFPLASLLSG